MIEASRFDLVIFDCDGVLVDSEMLTNRIFAQMLNELGLPVTLEFMFETFVGCSMAECQEKIAEMLGCPAPETFLPEYYRRTGEALRNELEPISGIHDALAALAIPVCVASSGSHEKMRITLGKTGLLQSFEGRIYSVTEVARGKPAPDVFLYAASRCGATPDRCLVVEDSPRGVQAGVAAGMTVLGFEGTTSRERLLAAGAHHVFSDMRELTGLITEVRYENVSLS